LGTRERGEGRTKEVINQDICGCHNNKDSCWDGKETYFEIKIFIDAYLSFTYPGIGNNVCIHG